MNSSRFCLTLLDVRAETGNIQVASVFLLCNSCALVSLSFCYVFSLPLCFFPSFSLSFPLFCPYAGLFGWIGEWAQSATLSVQGLEGHPTAV